MGSAFSPQTIAALVEVITGGSGMRQKDPIGIYRSGPVLEHFFGLAGLELEIGSQSRVPAVRKLLVTTNKQEDGFEVIRPVIEQVADPSEYLDDLSKTGAVVEYLNKRLQADKYELRLIDDRYRLLPRGVTAPVTSSLTATANFLNLDSVTRDFERALKQSESDPADAITAACSTVESVCKCLLDELKLPYPKDQSISPLVKEVQKHLNLSPAQKDIEPYLKQILGGLQNAASGIGALRTHSGDAHGRGKGVSSPDSRTARLAIHAASTISLFFVDTWREIHR